MGRNNQLPRPAMDGAVDTAFLARLVRSVYAGPAWHGASLRSALRGVTADEALRRVAPGRNSVWDLALHTAYARHRVLGRLAAVAGLATATPPRFPRRLRAEWWPMLPAEASGSPAERSDAWRADLALLDDYQTRLLDALAELPADALRRGRRGVPWSIADEITGIAAHDAYHAGQIRLLLRLSPATGAAPSAARRAGTGGEARALMT